MKLLVPVLCPGAEMGSCTSSWPLSSDHSPPGEFPGAGRANNRSFSLCSHSEISSRVFRQKGWKSDLCAKKQPNVCVPAHVWAALGVEDRGRRHRQPHPGQARF